MTLNCCKVEFYRNIAWFRVFGRLQHGTLSFARWRYQHFSETVLGYTMLSRVYLALAMGFLVLIFIFLLCVTNYVFYFKLRSANFLLNEYCIVLYCIVLGLPVQQPFDVHAVCWDVKLNQSATGITVNLSMTPSLPRHTPAPVGCDGCHCTHTCSYCQLIKSNLFTQIYHINIGSSKSVHEQGQQGWKQH